MVTKKIISKVCDRFPKIPPNIIQAIITKYNEESIAFMLENGYTNYTEQIRLDIVPITKRRYVLRGIEYESQRLYKLKATLGEELYNEIAKEYEKFREVL